MSNLAEHGFARCHATWIYRSRLGRCTVRWNTSRTYLELHASSTTEEVGRGSAGDEQDLRAKGDPAFMSTRPISRCALGMFKSPKPCPHLADRPGLSPATK